MRISIQQALKNVASDKYDKQNIFLLFCCIFIFNIIMHLPIQEITSILLSNSMTLEAFLSLCSDSKFTTLMFVGTIIGSFLNGIYIVATNNAINNNKGIFPHPFKEFIKIIISSVKFFFGALITIFLIEFIAYTLSIGLLFLFTKGFHLGETTLFFIMIAMSALVLLMVHAWLCVNFKFYMTLKFKDWFSFKESWIMISKILRRFASYIAKSIILFIIFFTITLIILFFTEMVLGIMGGITGNIQSAKTAIDTIFNIVQSAINCFFIVYLVDFNAQLLRPIAIQKTVQKNQES